MYQTRAIRLCRLAAIDERGSVVETGDRDLGFESPGARYHGHGDRSRETVAGITRSAILIRQALRDTRVLSGYDIHLGPRRGSRRRKERGREIRWIRVTLSSQQPVIPGAAEALASLVCAK